MPRTAAVQIRLAAAADLDDVLDILNEAARWLASRGINQWRADGFPRELIAGDIARGEVYVGTLDRRAAGTFTLQARGVGIELLKAAERITLAAGRGLLRLDCYAGNAVLCSYYERAGFVRRADIEVDGRDDPTVPESNVHFLARRYEKSLTRIG
jgi:GNAT superfamily N-acetyltransferase